VLGLSHRASLTDQLSRFESPLSPLNVVEPSFFVPVEVARVLRVS